MYFSTLPSTNQHEPFFSIWGIQREETFFDGEIFTQYLIDDCQSNDQECLNLMICHMTIFLYYSSHTALMFCGTITEGYLYFFWIWFLFEAPYDRLLFIFGVIGINS